ncbi:MAG: class I SAM-dependent methyltransferase [Halobacteriota archaeon]
MDSGTVGRTDNLKLYLKQVDRIFNIPQIINEPQEKSHIVRYYAKNKFTYMVFYNWGGFYHLGISYDGKRRREDVKEQARIIEGHMHDMGASRVLEIGCGLGPNSAFLARRNPDVAFEATDLSNEPLRRFTRISNLRFAVGDYHDLSEFKDNAYDIVFAIETLCYSTDKLLVLREVKKKLKPGGKFIVFDVYQGNRATPLDASEEVCLRLIERVVAAQKFERKSDVEEHMREEFSIAVAKDISQYVLPSLDRQESKGRFYFDHPTFEEVFGVLAPFDVKRNGIAVLLLSTSMRRQIMCYYMHVLIND